MRHAKAEQGDGLPDRERPLSGRGRHAAQRVGELLVDRRPGRILSSPSLRTRETVELVTEACRYVGPIIFVESLYLAEPAAYLRALAEHGGEAERVLVVGHNPGLEELVLRLSDEHVSLPTGALVELAFDVEHWSDVSGASHAELVGFTVPRSEH